MTVASIGLATTPGFFQAYMEKVFADYLWEFVVCYIDNIIIYSKSTKQHLIDLDKALTVLEDSGVTLSISKSHFAQPSIKALGHFVSRLGISTLTEKTEAI